MSLISAAALSAGCAGNSAMQNLAPADEAPAQQDSQALAQLESSGPGLPRESSDWFDIFPDLDPGIDWEGLIEALHQPLAEGDNSVVVKNYLYASSDAETVPVIVGYDEIFPGFEIPIFGEGVHLASAAGEMSYVTYGFTEIPAGKDMIHVSAQGSASYTDHAGAGLYIGVGDYNHGAYRWFGPFSADDSDWVLPITHMNTTNDTQHAYLTFAVYGGDAATFSHINVEVGEMDWSLDFDWADFEIGGVLDEDGFFDHYLFEGLLPAFEIPLPPMPDPPPGI